MPADSNRQRKIALLVCCSALFMTIVDFSTTAVALPSIERSLGATSSELQWVVSGYMLAFGLVPVVAGRLGDQHGRRRMFQISVAAFAATSALAALAPSPGWLIAARVLQGVAGGLINPQVLGLVQAMFSGPERPKAFGATGATVGLATALGPLQGGALIALGGPDLGWRLILLAQLPIGIAVLIMGRRHLHDVPSSGGHRIDLLGTAMLGVVILCVLLASVEFGRFGPSSLLLLVPATLFALLFWRWERHVTDTGRDPLINVRLLRHKGFGTGLVLALCFLAAHAAMLLVLTLYLQQGLDFDALDAGLLVTPFAVGTALSASVAGRIMRRIGRWVLISSAAVYGLGGASLLVVTATVAPSTIALAALGPVFVMGLGAGALVTPNQVFALAEVDPVMGGVAGGVLQTAQRVGASVGQAVIGAVYFGVAHSSGPADYVLALQAAIGVVLACVGASLLVCVVDLVLMSRPAAGARTEKSATATAPGRPSKLRG